MYALTVTSRKQLERASLRAQAEKLKMEEVVFGIYKVWGSTGKLYLVGIEPAATGGYDVCCTCPTQNTFCKHVSTVMPHYLMKKQEMEPDLTRCKCGNSGFSFFNNHWHCINCIRDMEARQAVTCKDCGGPATGGEGRCIECECAKDSADLFGAPIPIRSSRVKEAW